MSELYFTDYDATCPGTLEKAICAIPGVIDAFKPEISELPKNLNVVGHSLIEAIVHDQDSSSIETLQWHELGDPHNMKNHDYSILTEVQKT